MIHVIPVIAGSLMICGSGISLPDPGSVHLIRPAPWYRPALDDPDLCEGWPVFVNTPSGGFPYTPTLFDITGDGAMEVFFTGGHTFAVKGDGTFLPGWPETEMVNMGYGTTGQMPGPSVADLTGAGDPAVLWSLRDWYAGSSYMWSFNGKLPDGSNLGSFPHHAPDQFSNALSSPFVLGDSNGDGNLEAWSAHTLGNTGDYYRISGFDHTGSLLFTTDLAQGEQILNLYFGDLEGGGQETFFAVTSLSGSYLLYSMDSDGGIHEGYPVSLYTPGAGYHMFGPPLAADLDGDGSLEIVLGLNVSSVSHAMAVKHDGTPLPGFPMTVSSQSQLFYLGLGDVTGDGSPELIAFENHLGSAYRVFVISLETGEHLPGWPVPVPNWPKGFPTVVDVNADGVQDIVFVTDGGHLYALSGQGLILDGFPKNLAAPSISGVAAGDIDGDGLYELVAVTWNGWAYAWNTPTEAGEDNADWPMRGIDSRNTGVFRGSGGSTGILTPEVPPVFISPVSNPAAGSAIFSLSPGSGGTISIFDASGRLVREISADSGGQALWNPEPNDRNGVYFARLRTPAGTATAKFVLLR